MLGSPNLNDLATLRFLSMYRDAQYENILGQNVRTPIGAPDPRLSQLLPPSFMAAGMAPMNPYGELTGLNVQRALSLPSGPPLLHRLLAAGAGAGLLYLLLNALSLRYLERAALSKELTHLRLARLLRLLTTPLSIIGGWELSEMLTR